jgi:hypothetical protein
MFGSKNEYSFIKRGYKYLVIALKAFDSKGFGGYTFLKRFEKQGSRDIFVKPIISTI